MYKGKEHILLRSSDVSFYCLLSALHYMICSSIFWRYILHEMVISDKDFFIATINISCHYSISRREMTLQASITWHMYIIFSAIRIRLSEWQRNCLYSSVISRIVQVFILEPAISQYYIIYKKNLKISIVVLLLIRCCTIYTCRNSSDLVE